MKDFSQYKARRDELLKQVREQHPNRKNGCIVLFAGLEGERVSFRQNSTFFYFTGITEPGLVLLIDWSGRQELYVPNHGTQRTKWVKESVDLSPTGAKSLLFDAIISLGQESHESRSYQLYHFFSEIQYESLITRLKACIDNGGSIMTTAPANESEYVEQRFLLLRIGGFLDSLKKAIVDISLIIAEMRRTKDKLEIENIYRAIETTALAQDAAARSIRPDLCEAETQAYIEFTMTGSNARIAFPSIVGSGINSTILHYNANNRIMKKGELVVVDIGAEYNHYCADITRTYPVSGTFNQRQREIYELVLATQEYIASIAKPGMWLSNKEFPDQSLNHLARKYLAENGGYDKYMPHGIGHFLGLDVHDVGDHTRPLRTGDVITIEPGIYIAKEEIGIRIEDDYWIVDDGVICLSEQIPKSVEDIEAMAKELFEEDKDSGDLAESSHELASESEETDFSEDEYGDDDIMPLS